MNQLSEMARSGSLSGAEAAELDSYIHVSNLLALIRARTLRGLTPHTGELTRLFHPRTDEWHRHFAWNGSEIQPLTAIGRVTLSVLFMNDPELVWMRSNLTLESPKA
jgi:hypothetical protein